MIQDAHQTNTLAVSGSDVQSATAAMNTPMQKCSKSTQRASLVCAALFPVSAMLHRTEKISRKTVIQCTKAGKGTRRSRINGNSTNTSRKDFAGLLWTADLATSGSVIAAKNAGFRNILQNHPLSMPRSHLHRPAEDARIMCSLCHSSFALPHRLGIAATAEAEAGARLVARLFTCTQDSLPTLVEDIALAHGLGPAAGLGGRFGSLCDSLGRFLGGRECGRRCCGRLCSGSLLSEGEFRVHVL